MDSSLARHEGSRDDLYAAMPPLEAKKALFADVAGIRRARRIRGEVEVKLLSVDVKMAHLNAHCKDEAGFGRSVGEKLPNLR